MLAEAPSTEVVLGGRLHRGDEAWQVSICSASRLSLYVAFAAAPPPDRTEFAKLTVTTPGGKEVELSGCRLAVEYTRKGYHGRLVFLEDVYDLHALLFEGKLVNLKGFFQNLPLVLSQKERIKPAFRDYTSDLLYDLSVYKKFFNEQDRVLANEPAKVAEAAQQTLLRTEGRRFLGYFDAQLGALGELVQGFEKEEHERHGFYFRRKVWEHILASEFLKRTNLKPRGYAGDAEMMVMLYENQYVGNYVFNQLLHKHPVETPAAQAVRNRRRRIPQVLRSVLARFPELPAHGFKFMSVASGPAWELQDLFLAAEDFERFHCTLLDQDPEALASARQGIARIEAARDIRIQAEYLNESVRTMLRTRDMAGRFGQFHFIYSMGLFDYLTPPVARAVLAKLHQLLLPGGTLLVGNYWMGQPTRYYMEYWMDWVLYYRTEQDFLELTEGLAAQERAVSFDESRCQMFLQLTKPC